MTATTQVRPWDFSHVLDLVNSLSTKPESSNESPTTKSSTYPIRAEANISDLENPTTPSKRQYVNKEPRDLGDFTKLWDFLGSPAELSVSAPSSQSIAPPNTKPAAFTTFTNYTSDGAIDTFLSSKRKSKAKQKSQITPLPEQSSADEGDADTFSDGSNLPETPTLTKNQRKKRNRKERRAQEAALAAEEAAKDTTKDASAAVSESEATYVARNTPAKKASVHNVSTPPTSRYNLWPTEAHSRAVCATEPRQLQDVVKARDPQTPWNAVKTAVPATLPKAIKPTEPYDLPEAVKHAAMVLDAAKKQNHQNASALKTNRIPNIHATSLATTTNGASPVHDALHSRPKTTSTANAIQSDSATKFLPSSVQPQAAIAAKQSHTQQSRPSQHLPKTAGFASGIAPMVSRSGEDRHWALLLKLIGDFYEDRKHLISPMNLTTHNNNSKGIHVFVDASNIFIGFMEQLKRSRGIPLAQHIPSVDLSFDALALLMERRRPVAKRILVGSTPYLPAFDKAKAVGYECNILEKVYKARELTERQLYFKEQDRAHHEGKKRAKAPPANNVATVNGGGSGSGSGSETNAPQYAPARMIEQGVDEILHLKILESVVDTDVPGTMVLATGDAARAEYSEGFMAMVERALKKGWTVELVSWSKNISQMYTRRQWTSAWGERFRIITLDDYAEELLDM